MGIGKLLRVDLSTRAWKLEDIHPDIIRNFMGGIGVASRILYDETGPDVEPLSEENILIISPGILNGTHAPTAYRSEITTKSPLTGIIGTGNFGGLFGSNLRSAGFGSIVIKGRSSDPIYLKIDNDQIELKDARELWGKNTEETTSILKKQEGKDFSVLTIGQAGENLVRFACPVVDYYHAPGRSHAGCVMGSKKLKAIAVRGTNAVDIRSPQMFKEVSEEICRRIRDYPETGLRLKVGSTHIVAKAAERGILGGRNYQTGVLPESNELWKPEDFTKYLIKGPVFCGNCPLSAHYGCNTTIHVKEGEYGPLYAEGAGFSHPVWNWGSKCGIESFPEMLRCKEICNRYGMDQMGPIPFALELFQRGIITRKDLDGNELKWGDTGAIINVLTTIAYRRGIGDILAEGSTRAAELIGGEARKYALAIKGMEIMSGPDIRGIGMATKLGHLTCARGGDDLKTTHTALEHLPSWAIQQGMSEDQYVRWLLDQIDMFQDTKEEIYGHLPWSQRPIPSAASFNKWYEELAAARDSLGICLFATHYVQAIGPTHCSKLFSAVTGIDVSPEQIMEAGERIVNLMRVYNAREGMDRKNDEFPSRFYSEPLRGERCESPPLVKADVDTLRESYYRLRGWDMKTGNPSKEKLEALGLSGVGEDPVRRELVKLNS